MLLWYKVSADPTPSFSKAVQVHIFPASSHHKQIHPVRCWRHSPRVP
eukprot:COSAG02_NODE_47490_length_340_cov_2.045643_1_plen_46_part_01